MDTRVLEFCKNPKSDCDLPSTVTDAIKQICTLAIVYNIGDQDLASKILSVLIPVITVKLKAVTKQQRLKRRSMMFPYNQTAMHEHFALPNKLDRIVWRSHSEVIDNWELDVIPKGTVLFRGSSNFGQSMKKGKKHEYIPCGFTDNHSLPTYYTPDVLVANLYTAKSKDAPLQVLKTTKNLKLLRMDSPTNFTRLVSKRNSNHEAFAHFFGNCNVSHMNQHQMKLGRLSGHKTDFAILKWLCENGFDGYSAGWICDFPPEIAICEPLTSIVLDKIIHARAMFTRSDFNTIRNAMAGDKA